MRLHRSSNAGTYTTPLLFVPSGGGQRLRVAPVGGRRWARRGGEGRARRRRGRRGGGGRCDRARGPLSDAGDAT